MIVYKIHKVGLNGPTLCIDYKSKGVNDYAESNE